MPKVLKKDVVLSNEGVDEERIRDCAPGITSNEGHEIAETNQHHHVNILVSRVPLGAQSRAWLHLNSAEDPDQSNEGDLDQGHGDTKSIEGVLLIVSYDVFSIGIVPVDIVGGVAGWSDALVVVNELFG